MKLLYIDDDKALCHLVKRGLERRGYAVETCNSGDEGLARARHAVFDIIAIDHYMPGQDGLITLTQLKNLPAAPPVVYVTGSDESRIAVAALKEGAVDYVVKSGADDFVDLLASALSQAQDQVRLRRERDAATAALRAANARLEAIVAHQQVLIREVNHRVANSLQLVSSLVYMQMAAVKDGPARDALRDTQARIDAIVQVHRRLYTSEDVQFVNMHDYLTGLTAELSQSLSSDERCRLILDAQSVKLPTDTAVSLGVVVAELVTNACKYAYPDGRSGDVRIIFGAHDAGYRLVVEDDGPGFSAAPAQGTGLGRTVISAMAKNLCSEIVFDSGHPGVRAVLSFTPAA
jgi:two-component sensor histidine kinase